MKFLDKQAFQITWLRTDITHEFSVELLTTSDVLVRTLNPSVFGDSAVINTHVGDNFIEVSNSNADRRIRITNLTVGGTPETVDVTILYVPAHPPVTFLNDDYVMFCPKLAATGDIRSTRLPYFGGDENYVKYVYPYTFSPIELDEHTHLAYPDTPLLSKNVISVGSANVWNFTTNSEEPFTFPDDQLIRLNSTGGVAGGWTSTKSYTKTPYTGVDIMFAIRIDQLETATTATPVITGDSLNPKYNVYISDSGTANPANTYNIYIKDTSSTTGVQFTFDPADEYLMFNIRFPTDGVNIECETWGVSSTGVKTARQTQTLAQPAGEDYTLPTTTMITVIGQDYTATSVSWIYGAVVSSGILTDAQKDVTADWIASTAKEFV